MSTQRYSLTLPARKENLDLFIKAGLLLVIGALCFQILQPFLLPMVWGGIIAIALNPLVNLIRRRFGLSRGKSSAVITATVLAALIIPTVWFSGAAFTTTQALATSMADGSLVVPQPAAGVAEWPIVGEPLHKAWSLAATNLAGAVETYAPQLKSLATSMVAAIGSLGGGIVQFVIATLIAGVLMASAKQCRAVAVKIASRLLGEQGASYVDLSKATVRGVVQGVIGVAVIQAMLAGLGMGIAGVPAAGLLAVAVMILAIIQLPPILVLGPVMAYLFSVESTTVAVMFTVWGILVSASDAVLKPVLMGRGVDIPMVVILLGALGGMMMSGIVGLFVGAVMLSLGYKLLMTWLDNNTAGREESNTLPVVSVQPA